MIGNVYDGFLVEVRVDCSRGEIVTESKIRIDKEHSCMNSLQKCVLFDNA